MDITEFRALFAEVSTWASGSPRGSIDHLTPDRKAAAGRLVRSGETVGLGRRLDTEARVRNPQPPDHHMTLMPDDDIGYGTVRFAKDFIGVDFHNDGHSHIDALSHVVFDDALYGGLHASSISADGADSGSIEMLGAGLVGRGVLLDIPALWNVDWLDPGEQVWPEHLEAAENRQGVRIGPGDILLVRTGHSLAIVDVPWWDPAKHKAGLHPTAVRFLADRKVAALGSDGNSDAAPNAAETIGFPIHVLAVNAMGLYLMDYLQLEQLRTVCLASSRWEFLLVVAPLQIIGGTGSPVNPIAIF